MFFRLLSNHYHLQTHPQTEAEIINNRARRYSSVVEIKTNETVSPADMAAVHQFWATQSYFFIKRLQMNQKPLLKILPLELKSENVFSKRNILMVLERIINELDKKTCSDEMKRQLLALLVPPSSHSLERKIPLEEKKPADLSVLKADSIDFAYQQARQGKRVLIMDAANSQRPGAGAYEKGTFQEALTRQSDLYWQTLVDFRDVSQDLAHAGKNILKKTDHSIDILSYQIRFLKLILFFSKKSIEDHRYFETADFRKHFFNYADSIYGDMQNTVLEVPTSHGFLKQTVMADLGNIKKSHELFDKDGIFLKNLQEQKMQPLLIGEVAAPDKRLIEGIYDRACTQNRDLAQSRQDQVAAEIIRNSIEFILKKAIEQGVDILILNAFGCGAFKNSPQQVASIFSEALLASARDLAGKAIYFMDTNQTRCDSFDQVFSDKLKDKFNLNNYQREEALSVWRAKNSP